VGFLDWLRGKKSDGKGAGDGAATLAAASAAVRWLSAEESPFGVRTLDLRPFTHAMMSTTTDPENASRAVSWALATAQSIPSLDLGEGAKTVPCKLGYAVAPAFPDGLLFAPRAMEEKWALFHQAGSIVAVRSWTGKVAAIGRGKRDGDRLVIEELVLADGGIGPGDDPGAMFDWLVRTHALGQSLPLPLDEADLEIAQTVPVALFSMFGRMAEFAAAGFLAPHPVWPLRVFGAVMQAVRREDVNQVKALLADGADPNVPSPIDGYTALHVAMVNGNAEAMRALLAGGANARLRTDRGMDPVGLGIVNGAPREVLEDLLAAGAAADTVNIDGFGLLHAAAEVNRPEIVTWLAGRGLDVEARTRGELTPLHIASGLGHADAARALIAAGADVKAASPRGTPRQIAEAEKHPAVAALLP
jgi:hypothetical protein